jgi:alkanesulfonate monooxygenase SsuD/methylene tetrahydromethanopterin reductase-like flavin-dependent oxidoreductase (luciferase family)
VVAFTGRFYQFQDLSMDPKPVQHPRPPILYGGVTPSGARRAARLCDGFYPIFLDSYADPVRFAPLQEIIRRELEKRQCDSSAFAMIAAASARITARDDPEAQAHPRGICTGTAEQIVSDLARFAAAGYSLVVCFFVCPHGRMEELEEQMQHFGEDVLPHVKRIAPQGGWNTNL